MSWWRESSIKSAQKGSPGPEGALATDILGSGGAATDHRHAHWVPVADGAEQRGTLFRRWWCGRPAGSCTLRMWL